MIIDSHSVRIQRDTCLEFHLARAAEGKKEFAAHQFFHNGADGLGAVASQAKRTRLWKKWMIRLSGSLYAEGVICKMKEKR